MQARRNVRLALPRGSVDVDVLAEETVAGIKHSVVCECKNWQTNVPRSVVHAFRTVMIETGAHRGYVISRVGFQNGAREAAESTNVELVTFEEFQALYFSRWIGKRMQDLEASIGNFNTYYEPLGQPGYSYLGQTRIGPPMTKFGPSFCLPDSCFVHSHLSCVCSVITRFRSCHSMFQSLRVTEFASLTISGG